ncbi:hypothetical protein JNUCC23_10935 [Peribacillus sp. JNUCC 23]
MYQDPLIIHSIFYLDNSKKDVIFQAGTPIPLAVAISKMIFQDKEITEVKGIEEIGVFADV